MRRPPSFSHIMRALRLHVRDVVLEHTRIPNNCVASCRIAREALQNFGLEAEPLLCKLRVMNPELARRLSEWRLYNQDRQPPLMIQQEWAKAGAWCIDIGYGAEPGEELELDGHLVLTRRREGHLIDPSLGQTARLNKDIQMPGAGIFAPLDGAFFAGEAANSFLLNGCVLIYTPQPKRRDYERAPDWAERGRYAAAVRELVSLMEEDLRG